MYIPLIIGLPGSGKSTISKLLAQHLGMGYLSTDENFRIYRALPLDSKAKELEIMQNFLLRLKHEFPDLFPKVKRHAQKGQLSDSKLFRAFSEDIFRLFEIEMNKWMFKSRVFKNNVIDISASAILYEENRNIFSLKNGYKKFFFNTDFDLLQERILKDYKIHKEISNKRGKKMPIRGAYEIAIENAKKSGLSEKEAIKEQLKKDKNSRIKIYKKYADYTIKINKDTTTSQIISVILKEIL